MKTITMLLIIIQLGFADYTNNGDETFTDNVTGLIWQNSSDNNTNELSWIDAMNYCENLSISNNNNWRLPTINELITLINPLEYNPSIYNIFTYTANAYYWSSTTYINSKDEAWVVTFAEGGINMISKSGTSGRYVRCVSH